MNNSEYNDLFAKLEKGGNKISAEKKQAIISKIESLENYEAKIGVFGKTGAGKSTLCNALFGENKCTTCDFEACTRKPQELTLFLSHLGTKKIKIVDVPGVGENKQRDVEYSKLYTTLMSEIDLILWVLKGDERAYATDLTFYNDVVKKYVVKGKPVIFVVNQADKIAPLKDWNISRRMPGPDQLKNIIRKKQHVSELFDVPISTVVATSAYEKYNLDNLFHEMVSKLPLTKQILLVEGVNNSQLSKETASYVSSLTYSSSSDWDDNPLSIAIDIAGAGVEFVKGVGEALFEFLFPW